MQRSGSATKVEVAGKATTATQRMLLRLSGCLPPPQGWWIEEEKKGPWLWLPALSAPRRLIGLETKRAKESGCQIN